MARALALRFLSPRPLTSWPMRSRASSSASTRAVENSCRNFSPSFKASSFRYSRVPTLALTRASLRGSASTVTGSEASTVSASLVSSSTRPSRLGTSPSAKPLISSPSWRMLWAFCLAKASCKRAKSWETFLGSSPKLNKLRRIRFRSLLRLRGFMGTPWPTTS